MKTDLQTSAFASVNRVLSHNKGGNYGFYLGIVFRTLERSSEMIPLLLFFAWLHLALTGQGFTDLAIILFAPDLTSIDVVVRLAAVMLCVFALQFCFAFLGQSLSFLSSYQIMRTYRQVLINRVRRLPLGHLQHVRAGEVADVLTQDVKRIEGIFTHVAADLAAAICTPLLGLSLLIYLDVSLALGLICTLIVATFTLITTRRFLAAAGQNKHRVSSQVSGYLVEFISGLTTLMRFNKTSVWLSKLHTQFERLKAASIRVEKWGAVPVVSFRLIVEMSLVVALLLVAFGATSLVEQGQEAGNQAVTLVMFFMLALKVIAPLLEASEYLVLLRIAVQSENKINQLLPTPPVEQAIDNRSPAHSGVTFENVSFSYRQTATLKQITITAEENQTTAIVGPSGAGKSTLLALLARFYQPSSGVIAIGGVPLQQLGDETLYACLSCVFQQPYLFDGSILDNVRIGNPNATDEEVMQACRDAYCEAFIARLPDGYHSKIGEAGIKLSGGERQRLSIARGIVNPAPILLLDEVTASVDPSSQFYIQQSLKSLTQNKTVIMVAHRLSQVVQADKIIVMEEGRIVEQGEHHTLLENKALYYQLWQAQHQAKEQ